MRILYLDCDTLRPDHLSCYGYHRNTSPNIDEIAKGGLRFDNYYCSDAPCLPSRGALFNGRFGIHTGIVNHGGEAADPWIEGAPRGFRMSPRYHPWMMNLRNAGFYTVSVSPYAERHSAWWFYYGFREMFNPGKGGRERADEIEPYALDWIRRNGKKDNWFLQVNYWDPHTTYRTPLSYGNPFEGDPAPDWLTDEQIAKDYESYGPHSAHEPFGIRPFHEDVPRMPKEIRNVADFKQWIDGYDTGIRYMDDSIGRILSLLDEQGVLDDTVVMVSADHGENQGELNVYGDHQTADCCTSRIPMIIRWPGMASGAVDTGLHYNLDLPPTMTELLGQEPTPTWDGESFANALRGEGASGRDYLVVSQCAWSGQRSVRWDKWLLMRTYNSGLKAFPSLMLFNVEQDPHMTNNLASDLPDVVNAGLQRLEEWHTQQMWGSETNVDPLWTIIREGGPLHTRADLAPYCERLRATGRTHHAETLERLQGRPIDWWEKDKAQQHGLSQEEELSAKTPEPRPSLASTKSAR